MFEQPSVVGEGRVKCGPPLDSHATHEFFDDVGTVNQPVHRLAYLPDDEWIELAGPGENRAYGVKGQLVEHPKCPFIVHARVFHDPSVENRIPDAPRKDVKLPDLDHGDCISVIGHIGNDYLVNPGAIAHWWRHSYRRMEIEREKGPPHHLLPPVLPAMRLKRGEASYLEHDGVAGPRLNQKIKRAVSLGDGFPCMVACYPGGDSRSGDRHVIHIRRAHKDSRWRGRRFLTENQRCQDERHYQD
ncbi:MAG: hypothetical protein DDT25_01299 [Chloroflexi bacterium]|nr:hypothetical protein [Chloroflexota bacterium]